MKNPTLFRVAMDTHNSMEFIHNALSTSPRNAQTPIKGAEFPLVVPNATFFKTVENGSKACRGARYFDGSFAAGFARP
jgi:hypothetical protein